MNGFSLHNSPEQIKRAISIQVEALLKRQEGRKRNSFRNLRRRYAICSQCKRPMRKSTADIQITNKRENAPICIACIMGVKRKDKGSYVHSKKWKKEFKQYKDKYKKSKNLK